ncbi:UNVERIFIED_CONTAM: putative 60S ribosomal protein L37a-1 [Sesamum angustifolium]|uniref:60S ribosomal protein L37a-1 n=1 Tax=Sesamum angustifolium TaxID=2727405 RepID=A0AAW2PSS6_9LAMI
MAPDMVLVEEADMRRWTLVSIASTFCEFWKYVVKRKVSRDLGCKDCGKVKAGGAYTWNNASVVTVRSTIRRLREQTES